MKLRQSTAVDVLIGPFVDLTDGYTAEEAETPSVYLSKNGQALAAKNDATVPVHDDAGYYNCELDATDTNTVGILVLIVEASANALPVRHEFQVVEEAVYDRDYAASATGYVTLADGSHGGSSASLELDTLTITAATGDAVTISSGGGNGNGISIAGNGSGSGVRTDGGATGNGWTSVGGATSGDGIQAFASASGDGMQLTAAGNGNGLNIGGSGSGQGILSTGGTTGAGIYARGGGTSGDGIYAAAQTSGDGIEAVGAGGGYDINADINGTVSLAAGDYTGSVTVDANVVEVTGNSGAATSLKSLTDIIVHSGTAQAGTSNTITLDAGASATDGAYDPAMIYIVGGTGVGQTRLIYEYNGTTKVAVVDRNWKTNPDATSDFVIQAHPGREHVNEGLAQDGAASTITLNALASSDDDAYNGQLVFIRSGTGEDQVRLVTDYDGTTKVATVAHAWDTNPDATSGYAMLPNHIHTLDDIADAVWDETAADHVASGSTGESLSTATGAGTPSVYEEDVTLE